MTKGEMEIVEMNFDAIAAAIQNRCYQDGNLAAMRRLEQIVREDLDRIREILVEE